MKTFLGTSGPTGSIRVHLPVVVRAFIGKLRMTDPLLWRISQWFPQKRFHIERACEHVYLAITCSWPFLHWPVTVQLDSISVWVVEIQGFTDAVIARAIQRNIGPEQAPQSCG